MTSRIAFLALLFAIAAIEGAIAIGPLWIAGAMAVAGRMKWGWRIGAAATALLGCGLALGGASFGVAVTSTIAVAAATALSGSKYPLPSEVWALVQWCFRAAAVPAAVAGLILLTALPPSTAFWQAMALGGGILCIAPAAVLAQVPVPRVPVLFSTLSATMITFGGWATHTGVVPAAMVFGALALTSVMAPMPTTLWALATVGGVASLMHSFLNGAEPEMITLALLVAGGATLFTSQQIAQLRNTLLETEDRAERRTARIRYLLQDRDEVTALAVHDLQSPIQAIGGLQKTLLHMLDTGRSDSAQMKSALKVAIDTSADLSDRVASVLSDKRPHLGGQGDTVLASTMINHVVAAHRLALDENALTVLRDIPTDTYVDHSEDVKDLLDVLVDNAIRHAPPRSQIKVSVLVDPIEKRLNIKIADAGPGLRNKTADEVFAAPVRAAPEGRQGMGLFLAYRRARSLGGTLSYRPSASGGACFILSLPQAI